MHEQTQAEHRAQREMVLRSLNLADTPEDRHGTYPSRKPRHVPPMPLPLPVLPPTRVYRLPEVRERRG